MTSTPNGIPSTGPAAARARAAALFAAAARHGTAGPTAVLHCLAAVTALRVPTQPVPASATTDPELLIRRALRILGGLDAEDFAQPDVLTAARHGRRALLDPR